MKLLVLVRSLSITSLLLLFLEFLFNNKPVEALLPVLVLFLSLASLRASFFALMPLASLDRVLVTLRARFTTASVIFLGFDGDGIEEVN